MLSFFRLRTSNSWRFSYTGMRSLAMCVMSSYRSAFHNPSTHSSRRSTNTSWMPTNTHGINVPSTSVWPHQDLSKCKQVILEVYSFTKQPEINSMMTSLWACSTDFEWERMNHVLAPNGFLIINTFENIFSDSSCTCKIPVFLHGRLFLYVQGDSFEGCQAAGEKLWGKHTSTCRVPQTRIHGTKQTLWKSLKNHTVIQTLQRIKELMCDNVCFFFYTVFKNGTYSNQTQTTQCTFRGLIGYWWQHCLDGIYEGSAPTQF